MAKYIRVMASRFSSIYFLIGIFILGGFLRLYKIDKRCFYGDEVLTLDIISQSSVQNVWQRVVKSSPCELPFFYTILFFWSFLSKSTFWLRTLSALSGLSLILVSYRLSKYLFDRNTALLTSYLISISSFFILYGQTIRYFSFNALFNLLSLYLFIKAMHNNHISRWFFYIVIRTISLYINYSSFLFFFSEGLFALFYRKKYLSSFKNWLFCFIIIFILWFPMSPYLLRDFNLLLTGEGFKRIPLKIGWIGNLFYFFFSFSLGTTVSPFNYPVVIVAVIIYLFIFIYFLKDFLFKHIQLESITFIILSLLIPTVICAIFNYNSPSYVMASSVIYLIIISLGILNAPRKIGLFLTIAISMLSFYSLYNLYNERQYHNMEFIDDWDEIASYVNHQERLNDIIIYNSNAFAYYLNKINCQMNTHGLPDDEQDIRAFISKHLENNKIFNIILVDSPLSVRKVADYREETALLHSWLKKNNFELVSLKYFDRDPEADKKRRYVNRPFPEYHTTVYIYSKE